jgi:hypothetical protein
VRGVRLRVVSWTHSKLGVEDLSHAARRECDQTFQGPYHVYGFASPFELLRLEPRVGG